MLVFWCVTKDHPTERLGEADPKYMGDGEFNQKLQMHGYYMLKCIKEGFLKLPKEIELNTLEYMGISMKIMEERIEILGNKIRRAYGGDLDEFIIDTINDVQFDLMTSSHEKLGILVGFEQLGMVDFNNKLSPSEIWRRLFTLYFDKEEDSFMLFLRTYTYFCLKHYYKDFLNKELPFRYIAPYGMYINDSVYSDTPLFFLDDLDID